MPARIPHPRLLIPFAAAARRVPRGEVSAAMQLVLLLGLLWLGLFGGEELIFGAIAVVATAVLSRMVVPLQMAPLRPLGLAAFIAHFLTQSLLGGIDVAGRAFHPRCPLVAGKWRYQLRLAQGEGRMLFIGCIGVIPGTVAYALRGDELRVHSIAGDPRQQLMAMEQRVAALYGIRLPSETT